MMDALFGAISQWFKERLNLERPGICPKCGRSTVVLKYHTKRCYQLPSFDPSNQQTKTDFLPVLGVDEIKQRR